MEVMLPIDESQPFKKGDYHFRLLHTHSRQPSTKIIYSLFLTDRLPSGTFLSACAT